MRYLYMKCSKDKYELPIAVADTVPELAKMLGLSADSIYTMLSKHYPGYHKVALEED